jgi:hypothetical protein
MVVGSFELTVAEFGRADWGIPWQNRRPPGQQSNSATRWMLLVHWVLRNATIHPRHVVPLKTEAICSSETFVPKYQTTRSHNPKDHKKEEQSLACLNFSIDLSTLSPHSAALTGKLAIPQLVKKFSPFYRTQRFITVFTTSHHFCLFWARWTNRRPSILFL